MDTDRTWTVSKLRALLEGLPDDMVVLTSGYEGEFADILPDVEKTKYKPMAYYYGDWDENILTTDEGAIDALVLHRQPGTG